MNFKIAVIVVLVGSGISLSAQNFDAKQQFTQKCAMCHGADGKTPTMIGKNLGSPDLSSEKVQKLSDKEIHEILLHGKGKMPSYEKAFGDKNIDAMVKYVRGLKK